VAALMQPTTLERPPLEPALQATPARVPDALAPESLSSLEAVSRELDISYRDMQAQVSRLQLELVASRSARMRELAEKERLLARLSSLVAILPGGVLLLDGTEVIRDANPEALELLGEPLLGETWSAIAARNEVVTDSVGNEGRHLSISSRALEEHGEEVVLITDTTELRELQRQLGRRQRLSALGEMAARLAHQIRTPLSATSLYLAQLASPELPAAERARICERISGRLHQTEALIESMLSFARGRSPVTERISLRDVLESLDTTLRPTLADTVSLSITPVDDTLQLQGSREDLAGALANLVTNAMEVGGAGTHIEVWAGATSSQALQIRVRDNGPGIPEEILARIFDPFFSTRAKGTGLGLAVAAMTAQNHGGELTARNRAGGGAEFRFDLPLQSDTPTPQKGERT
jgi:two-component system sensor histidine kinase FlrB